MSLFWNKKIDSNSVVYSRTLSQKRLGQSLIVFGFVLFLGIPTLIKSSSFISSLINESQTLASMLLFLMAVGVILVIFTVISISLVNFKIANAKRDNKKFEITSNQNGDVVTIEN